MEMKHTLSVIVENKPGVLARTAGLFRRRGFNIDSLAVGVTENPKISRMTIVVEGDQRVLDQVMKQVNKLIEVIKVGYLEDEESVGRELALIKVNADQKTRSEIMQIVDIFRARIIDVAPNSLIVEVTGDENKINAMSQLLKQFGIKEMVRTGKVALQRGEKTLIVEEEID
ncbi:MAG: acetolactate synthase small subunit [Methanocellales archaeon]